MEHQQQHSYLSPSEDASTYHPMNFELPQIKFHNHQQQNNHHTLQGPSFDLRPVGSTSTNHHSPHRSNTYRQHQYILPSEFSSLSSPSLRYLSDDYSAAPQHPSPSFSHPVSKPLSQPQDIVLYPEGSQQNHYLPMFPSPSSTRSNVVQKPTDTSYLLPKTRQQFQHSVSSQDKYYSAQQKSS